MFEIKRFANRTYCFTYKKQFKNERKGAKNK